MDRLQLRDLIGQKRSIYKADYRTLKIKFYTRTTKHRIQAKNTKSIK
jgi:hypothetical protein